MTDESQRPLDAATAAMGESARQARPALDGVVFSKGDLERARELLGEELGFALLQFAGSGTLTAEAKADRVRALLEGCGLTPDDLPANGPWPSRHIAAQAVEEGRLLASMTDEQRAEGRRRFGTGNADTVGDLMETRLAGYARLLEAGRILENTRIGVDPATAERIWASEVGAAGRRATDLAELDTRLARERRMPMEEVWGPAAWAAGASVVTLGGLVFAVPVLPWVSGAASALCLLATVAGIGMRASLRSAERRVHGKARDARENLHQTLSPARTAR